MTKKELLTGDIVVTKCGELGVVIKEKNIIMYQNKEYDFLDSFTEDLTIEDHDYDIIEVYRSEDGAISFNDYDDEEPLYERGLEHEEKRQICIITQYFYGNRTQTFIDPDDVDYFINGHLDKKWGERYADSFEHVIVPVPDSDNVVILYDKHQEEKARERGKKFVSCSIPEIGLTLESRCIICRQDADGNLQSIEPEDGKYVSKYFTA